jgi:phage tail sheath gpL-like
MALIPITGVPSTYRVPGGYTEILFAQGPSTAAAAARDVIFVMPKLYASGSWSANKVVQVRNEQEAIVGAGAGSPLHRAIRKFLMTNNTAKIFALPYLPSSGMGSASADLEITFTNSATGSGVATATIAGVPCTIAIKQGDSPKQMAANMIAVINAQTWLPVTASNAMGVITLVAKIAGASQNAHIRVRVEISAGITTTFATENASDVDSLGTGTGTAGVDGATTEQANLTTALAAIASSRYYYMAFSVEDSNKLGVIKSHISTKSQPIPGLRSVGIAASPLALADVTTLSNGLNYERLQLVWQKNSEATREELAANMAAVRQKREQLDSAYNFDGYNNINGDWLIPACFRDADRASGADQNDAILDGITIVASRDSGSYVVMSCSTRSKDSTGNYDDFRATETHRISVSDEFVDTLLLRHALNYANKKLASDELLPDGTINYNQRLYPNVITPSNYAPFIKALLDEFAGERLQKVAQSKTGLRVVRDPNNGGRLEVGVDINSIDLFHQMTARVAEISAA